MNLYNKYRPTSFKDMKGNHRALVKAFDKPGHSQVFLFAGPPGCGKTTAAFIMAKMAGADDLNINYYNFADTRGIDTSREIIEECRFKPIGAPAKAYVIDEFHQVTAEGSSAFLHTLEFTPPGVYFFLCTSEPAKVKADIKSRATLHEFEPVAHSDLVDLLGDVCDAEKFDLSLEELEQAAELADGSPRAALVLLEQIAGLDEAGVQKVFESQKLAENSEVIDLCRSLFNGSSIDVRKHLKALKIQKADPEGCRRAILGFGTSVVLDRGNTVDQKILECFADSLFASGFPGLVIQCLRASQVKIKG